MPDILHIDMDSFFASIEIVEKPELRNVPVVVSNDKSKRSVVSTANYVARRYGIHSAMPLLSALKKCRNLVVLNADFEKYERCSRKILAVMENFTPSVEQASIDEFYIDVRSSHMLFGTSEEIAGKIKDQLKRSFQLTCSIGIADNKLLAKIGSNLNKPDGLTIIDQDHLHEMIDHLDVSLIPGIGPKATTVLHTHNIFLIKDLQQADLSLLKRLFGINALYLYQSAMGIGSSEIIPDTDAGSISHETTLDSDTLDDNLVRQIILELSDRVAERLRSSGLSGRVIKLKIRYFDFKTMTRQVTLNHDINTAEEIFHHSMELVNDLEERPIRLIGVGVSSLWDRNKEEQLLIFDTEREDSRLKQEKEMDDINRKFGKDSIKRASLL